MGWLFAFAGRLGRGGFWLGQAIVFVLSLATALLYLELDVGIATMIANFDAPLDEDGVPVPAAGAPGAEAIAAFIGFFVILVVFLLTHPVLTLAAGLFAGLLPFVAPEFYMTVVRSPGDPPVQLWLEGANLIAGLLLSWMALALATRRAHDRGQSGWWLLVTLVPFIGGVWWLVNLGIMSGDDGENRFGPPSSGGTSLPADGEPTAI